MLASTEQRLKEIVFFLYSGLNLLDKETKHELNIKTEFANYFGRGYMVIKFAMPDLGEFLLFNENSNELIRLMNAYKIESLDNIEIKFKIQDINDNQTRDEWMTLAAIEIESIVSKVKMIFEPENVLIKFEPKK